MTTTLQGQRTKGQGQGVTATYRELGKKDKAVKRWFSLGRNIQSQTVDEALKEGGIDWTVSKRPMLTSKAQPTFPTRQVDGQTRKDINPIPMGIHGTDLHEKLQRVLNNLVNLPDDSAPLFELNQILPQLQHPFVPMVEHYAVVRDDIDYPLGVLGGAYNCISNRDCVSILESLIQENRVTLERIGAFNYGRNVWVIAKLPGSLQIGPDTLDQYIKISWSHDGSEKLSATFIAYLTRNNIQFSPKVPNARVSFEIRHTLKAHDRIKIAEDIISSGEIYFKKVEECLNKLAGEAFSDQDMEAYLKSLFKTPGEDDEKKLTKHGKPRVVRSEQTVERIMEIFRDTDDGTVGHTKYAGYLAVAQWADHEKQIRVTTKTETEDEKEIAQAETRMQGLWMKNGTAFKLKEDAFASIIK